MKRITFWLLIQLFFINAIIGQEPLKIIADFFLTYETTGIDNALDSLFATNTWMLQRSRDEIDNVKVQLKSILQIVGNYYGYEIITHKSIGESFRLFSCLIKYDRQPIRFTFIFYKPQDIWKIYNFQFDQDLSEELDESAKVYRLKENLDY
jgi:hypothetical protein